MADTVRPFLCQQCAKEKANWTENCPHAMEVWKNGYDLALRERPRYRLTSEDVRQAISNPSFSWKNVHHLAADALNRILDEKDKTR
jgi:hypothetical protein